MIPPLTDERFCPRCGCDVFECRGAASGASGAECSRRPQLTDEELKLLALEVDDEVTLAAEVNNWRRLLDEHAELRRRLAEETPPVGAMVTPAHLVGRLTCTEEERKILDTMARVDEMALQMTAENEDTELDPDDPYVMVCVHELARREAERAKGGA